MTHDGWLRLRSLTISQGGFFIEMCRFWTSITVFHEQVGLEEEGLVQSTVKNPISIREASQLLNLHLMKAEQPSDSIKSDLKYS